MSEPTQNETAEQKFRAAFPDAECQTVCSVVRVRYRVFARGKYWGHNQKSAERAWLSAIHEWLN